MLVFQDSDSQWVAYLSQLDLSSAGPTKEQAIENLKEATIGWFEAVMKNNTLIKALQELNWFSESIYEVIPTSGDLNVY